MLRMVCIDVETEPVLQEITGEELNRGANKAPDARLHVHARRFWNRQQSAFFDVRVCHPNADSYRELSPKQIFQLHENEKRQYSQTGSGSGARDIHPISLCKYRWNGR